MTTVLALVGNPKSGSRTLTVANEVVKRLSNLLLDRGVAEVETCSIDLAESASEMFDWTSPRVNDWVQQVRSSDLVVIASPVYKASFTGLLKAFLDRIPHEGLAGIVAVPLMVGAAPHHAMAPDTQLRPLLVELCASCPTKSLFVLESDLGDLKQTLDSWMGAAAASIPAFTKSPNTP